MYFVLYGLKLTLSLFEPSLAGVPGDAEAFHVQGRSFSLGSVGRRRFPVGVVRGSTPPVSPRWRGSHLLDHVELRLPPVKRTTFGAINASQARICVCHNGSQLLLSSFIVTVSPINRLLDDIFLRFFLTAITIEAVTIFL